MNENSNVAYGKDELTFSINHQQNKTEDWMADWSGRIVIEGKTYFLNGYIKKEGWVAGRVKPDPNNKSIETISPDKSITEAPTYNENEDDIIPF